jgi:protein O-mannosyl-transferase
MRFAASAKSLKRSVMSRQRLVTLLLTLGTLIVFLPAGWFGFVNFDDSDYVTNNNFVKNGLTVAGVRWAFTTFHACNWHPLTWISHMTDFTLFGLNPGAHHYVNILFHAVNVALLFTLLRRLTNLIWPSALVAALFAWHPLHVESVAWISERKDVLSTFFALLSLLSYVRYAQKQSRVESRGSSASTATPALDPRPSNLDHSFALIFFALGLMSKPMLVTLPFVMLLLDFWPLQRFSLSAFRFPLLSEKIPFFLLTIISCVVTYFAQRNEAVASLAKVPLQLRFENSITAYTGYLFKTIWPVHLSVFYPLPGKISFLAVAASAAFLIFISALVWLERKRNPWLLVGWFWFAGMLVPVIGLVQVGDQAMADRYTYFPLIGIFIAAVFAFEEWVCRFRFQKIAGAVAGVVILSACLALTENQLRYWHDSESLFTHALAVTKDNALAHLNLGAAFEENGKSAEALSQYQQALALNPQRYEADNNIGKLLYEMNKPEEALSYCLKAVELNPKRASSHNSLGLVLVALNRFDEAMSQFFEAAHLDANYVAPRFQTGRTLLKLGRDADAIPFFHEALQIEPDNYPMLIYVARVLASDENSQIRNGTEALALAGEAVQLAGGAQPVALDTLAMACAEAGRFDEAIQLQQQAVKLAESASQTDDAVPMQQRLELYKNHQPWRESFLKK